MKLIKSDIVSLNEMVIASVCYKVNGQALNIQVRLLAEYLRRNENGIVMPSSEDVGTICNSLNITLANYNAIRGRLAKEELIVTKGKQIKLHPLLASIGWINDGFMYKIKE